MPTSSTAPSRAKSSVSGTKTVQELENRLRKRGTETEESLRKRVEKAEYELSFAPQFDKIILNDNLDVAREEMLQTIREFLDKE